MTSEERATLIAVAAATEQALNEICRIVDGHADQVDTQRLQKLGNMLSMVSRNVRSTHQTQE